MFSEDLCHTLLPLSETPSPDTPQVDMKKLRGLSLDKAILSCEPGVAARALPPPSTDTSPGLAPSPGDPSPHVALTRRGPLLSH